MQEIVSLARPSYMHADVRKERSSQTRNMVCVSRARIFVFYCIEVYTKSINRSHKGSNGLDMLHRNFGHII